MQAKYNFLRLIDRGIEQFNNGDYCDAIELLNSYKQPTTTERLSALFGGRNMTSAAPPSAHAAARAIHEAIDAFNARYGTVSMDMDTFRRKNPAATETVADEPLDVVFRDASQAAVPEPAMETPVRRWFETLIRVRNAGGDAGATQAGASGAAPFGPGLRAGGRIYAG